MVANVTGEGQTRGLDAREDAGQPRPSRPERAAANAKANHVPDSRAEGHADAKTDLTCNPWERFR